MKQTFDAIVVGLGAMGSAALYQLAKRGASVLGIDRFSPPHAEGSSHGETRITRLAIGEGAEYVPLVLRSHEIWREIESEVGESLLTTTGGLVFGRTDGTQLTHGVPNFVDATLATAREHNLDYEILDFSKLETRFPQFSYKGSEVGYYEPHSGVLRPERCISVQLALAESAGAKVIRNTAVESVDTCTVSGDLSVVTDAGQYRANKVVLSVGPWIQEFVPSSFAETFKVCRQVLYWFDVEDISDFLPGKFPIFIKASDANTRSFYGFPAMDGPSGGIKVATERYDQVCLPSTCDRGVSAEETEEICSLVSKSLPVKSPPLRAATCMYTVTPNFGFIIDEHPELPGVIVASPCSGHGFKHSPAIGEICAKLALGEKLSLDISAFSFENFK